MVEYGESTWLEAITNLPSSWFHLKKVNNPQSKETCKISGKNDAVFTP